MSNGGTAPALRGGASSPLVALGVIGAPHGLRGEVRLKLHNPRSSALAAKKTVRLRWPDGAQPERAAVIRSIRETGPGFAVLGIEGVQDRDGAVALRGAELCVTRAELPPLEPGEHYFIDLVGLRVRLADGTEIGTVLDAIEYPASQVLRIAIEGGELELPMMAPYLVEVSVERGEVIAAEIDDLERLPAPRGATR